MTGHRVPAGPGNRNIPADVLGLIQHLAAVTPAAYAHRHEWEPCNIPHLGYELHVERPRKAGIDPDYRALMAEAEAEAHHKAAS